MKENAERDSKRKENEVQEWDIDCILSSIASNGMWSG